MIHLIRHTKPEIATGVCYGQSDLALAKTFLDELSVVKQKVTVSADTMIFSSPLQRCKKLAMALFDESSLRLDHKLIEMDFGDWEMQGWDSIDKNMLASWGNDFVTIPSPNGESLACVHQRVMLFWRSLELLSQDYVLVTHAGVIRVILAHLLESPLNKAFTLDVSYGEVIRIDFIDGDNCTVKFL